MVTMKDVAKRAGVSHGTVSNVLNGSKSVSSEKIKRVQQAMDDLGYKPNSNAQSLKMHKSGRIAVILPDVTHSPFAVIYEEINQRCMDHNLSVCLHSSNSIPDRECLLLEQTLASGVDGAIVLTCQPQNTEFFTRIIQSGLPIVFIHRSVNCHLASSVILDVREPLMDSIRDQVEKGVRRIAILSGPKDYSFDNACVNGYIEGMSQAGLSSNPSYIETVNSNKESAMRAMCRLLELPERPQIVYTSNPSLRSGAESVLKATSMPDEPIPAILCLDSEDRLVTGADREKLLMLPYPRMARVAFEHLRSAVNGNPPDARTTVIPYPHTYGFEIGHVHSAHRSIRVLTQESPSSHSIKSLAANFTRSTGIRLELNQVPYHMMHNEITRGVPNGSYDAFTFGIEWFKELALNGFLHNLTSYYPDDQLLPRMFSGDILREHCYYGDQLYALPFSMTVQLMFYRKDLFNQLRNQRLYFEQTKQELKVPTTWAEYNQAARFFARKFNLESDTRYGTTLGAFSDSGAVCEFLPRLWSAGGNIFEDGKVVIDRPACVSALECYIEAFQYANPESPQYWWDEQVEQFAHGDAAMMCIFSDHATCLEDRSASNVVGKVGFSLLPGNNSVLGGWSIGVNPGSTKTEEAFEFAKWTASQSLAALNAMFGRIVPYRSVLESGELYRLYPWYRLLPRAFSYTRRRSLPKNSRREPVSEVVLEHIISKAVHAAIDRQNTASEALLQAGEELRQIIRG